MLNDQLRGHFRLLKRHKNAFAPRGLTLYTLNWSIRESKQEKTAFIDETMSIAPSMVE